MKGEPMEKSRAIELLEHLAWDRDIERNPYGDALNIAIDALRQSEPCSDKSYTLWKESYEELKKRMDELTSCSDLISRQAAIDAAKDWYEGLICGSVNGLIKRLNALPPAQPETAKRIVGKSRDGMTLWYQCDMCDEPVDEQDNYCRGCGRRLIDG